jgi:hypothetical protein
MIRIIAIVLGALGLAAAVQAGPVTWENTKQRVQAEIGQTVVPVVFRFRNDGSAPVTFARVVPTCGCTVGELTRMTWQPGETGELTAQFRVGEFEGHRTVTIRVGYAAPENATDTLELEVDIESWAEVKPRLLWWRSGEAPEARRVEIAVSSRVDDARVEIVDDASGAFSLERQAGQGAGATIAVVPVSTEKAATSQVRVRIVRPDGRAVERTLFLRVM